EPELVFTYVKTNSGSDPEFLLKAGFGALRREALAGLCGVDDKAHVAAAADFLDRILHRKREHHLAAVDFGDGERDRGREAHRRGGEVVDGHVRADRVLARIEVLEQEVAAGVLDV